jgi:hypothetical protein
MKTAPRLDHLSYSSLSTYQSCGRQWELSYFTPDVPRIPQGAFLGGIAMHEAIEWAENEKAWKQELGPILVESAASTRFQELVDEAGGARGIRWAGRKSAQYPAGEDYDWWTFHFGVFSRRWIELRNLWDFEGHQLVPGSVEMTFRAGLPDSEVALTGRTDAIFADPDGEIRAVDYKLGRKGGADVFQLAIQAWAIAQARELTITTGQFVYLRGPQVDTLDLTPYLPLVPKLFGDLEKAVEAGVFLHNPGPFCVSCSVRLSCEVGQLLSPDTLPKAYRDTNPNLDDLEVE